MCRAVNFVANAMIDGKTTPHEIGIYLAKWNIYIRKLSHQQGIDVLRRDSWPWPQWR